MPDNILTRQIIGAAIEVHKLLGPGLIESAYEHCLCHEFTLRGLPFERQRRSRWSTKASSSTADFASIFW